VEFWLRTLRTAKPPPPDCILNLFTHEAQRSETKRDSESSDTMESAIATPMVPASRQKSCNNCVQSKRRCDQRTPVCTRCAEKKSTCVYGKKPGPSPYSSRNFDTALEMEGLEFANSAGSPFPADSSLDVDYLGRTHIGAGADAVTEPVPSTMLDTVSDFHTDIDRFLDLMGEDGAGNDGQWLVQAYQGIMTERPGTPADEEIHRTYKKIKMNSLCVSQYISLRFCKCLHESLLTLSRDGTSLGSCTTPNNESITSCTASKPSQ
jgi:hypothetical protein